MTAPADFARAELERRGVPTRVSDHGTVSVDALAPLLVRLRSLEDALAEARVDPVTRLPTRAVLDRAFTRARDRAARHGIGLAVVLVDVDHFKAVNDGRGHRVGDDVLRHVAEVVRREARAHDFVGRWGGDELVVVMEGATAADAQRFAERAIHCVREYPAPGGPVTASAGYAALEPGLPAAALFDAADGALYRAKASGRDRASA